MAGNGGVRDYWLNTGWGCGMVKVDCETGRVVRGGAPVFRRFVGQHFGDVVRKGHYQVRLLKIAGRAVR